MLEKEQQQVKDGILNLDFRYFFSIVKLKSNDFVCYFKQTSNHLIVYICKILCQKFIISINYKKHLLNIVIFRLVKCQSNGVYKFKLINLIFKDEFIYSCKFLKITQKISHKIHMLNLTNSFE